MFLKNSLSDNFPGFDNLRLYQLNNEVIYSRTKLQQLYNQGRNPNLKKGSATLFEKMVIDTLIVDLTDLRYHLQN